MKKRNQILALAMGVCFLESTQSLAAANSPADLELAIQKVNQQTEQLQQEVKMLKAQLREVKQEKQTKGTKHHAAEAEKPAPAASTDPSQLLASTVTTGPLPIPTNDLDPSSLLTYQSSLYLERSLLEQNQAADNLPNDDPNAANKSKLLIGGKLEAQGLYSDGYGGNPSPTRSSIDLATAEIDAMARVSQDAYAFAAINYDNAAENPVLNGSGNVVNNSNFYLNRGFLTIGNLNKTPFYLTAGQMYVPFGSYGSYILSNPITKVLGRTNTRAVELGYDNNKQGFNASAYVFDGAANSNNNGGNTLNNWGANGGYNFKLGEYNAGLNVGYINDISSSQGAQQTGSGAGTFQGFSNNSATESLVHYVPGFDVNGVISRGPIYFLGEGITATRSYDPMDMQYNGAGADPKSVHFEGGYIFKWFNKRSVLALAYDQSWQGLALGLPKNSYIAAFNMSIWKNTVETLEFRHDVNYSSSDTSGGVCALPGGGTGTCVTQSPGGSQNTILGQIGVYF